LEAQRASLIATETDVKRTELFRDILTLKCLEWWCLSDFVLGLKVLWGLFEFRVFPDAGIRETPGNLLG
jgi:hypothetical protein